MNSVAPFGDPGGHVRAISNKDCDYIRYVDDEPKPTYPASRQAAPSSKPIRIESVQSGINRCFVLRRSAY